MAHIKPICGIVVSLESFFGPMLSWGVRSHRLSSGSGADPGFYCRASGL